MPTPFQNLQANLREVDALFALHQFKTGTSAGRRHGVEVLNKAAVVLTVACWEAFVEDVAVQGAEHLARVHYSPAIVPKHVQQAICRRVRDDKNEIAAWQLTDTGWRSALLEHVRAQVDRFHTPKSENVDELLQRCIGLPKVSDNWSWNGMSAAKARAKLDSLNSIRGVIAHRVSAEKSVRKGTADEYATFIEKLALLTNSAASRHLKKCTGDRPWRRRRAA